MALSYFLWLEMFSPVFRRVLTETDPRDPQDRRGRPAREIPRKINPADQF